MLSSWNSSTERTTLPPLTGKVPTPVLVRTIVICMCSVLKLSAEYRSAIFYTTPEQEETAKKVTAEVQEK